MAKAHCASCEAANVHLWRPTRVVAFADALEGVGVPQRHLLDGAGGVRADYIISTVPWSRSSYGGIAVAYACALPALKRLGGGVTVIWGRNGGKLLQMVRDRLEDLTEIVLLALVPGTRESGGAAGVAVCLMRERGVEVFVTNFSSRSIVVTNHEAPPGSRVRRVQGRQLEP